MWPSHLHGFGLSYTPDNANTLRCIVVRPSRSPTGPAEVLCQSSFRGDLCSSGAATASAFDSILCLAHRHGGGVASIEPRDAAAVNASVRAMVGTQEDDRNSLGYLPIWTVKVDPCRPSFEPIPHTAQVHAPSAPLTLQMDNVVC